MEIVNVPNVKDRKAYSKVRLLESMVELRIALEMLKEGYTRNSAQKVFMAWKAIISALVSLNLDKLGKNEKEKEWYKKSGFSAPTTKLKLISNDLEKIGYDKISFITNTALLLHSYAYNGIYEGLTPYSSKKDAVMDILSLTHFILDNSKNYFKEIWNEEHEKELENVKKLLEEIERNKSS